MMPQISDPRIEVDTFNAPNAPILPNVLPRPKIEVNLKMPSESVPSPPIHIVEEKHVMTQENQHLSDILEEDMEEAFLEGLSKKHQLGRNFYYKNGVKLGLGEKIGKIQVTLMRSPTDRMLYRLKSERRLEKVLDKIDRIQNEYVLFKTGLDNKLEFLDFIREKWKKYKLNIIV